MLQVPSCNRKILYKKGGFSTEKPLFFCNFAANFVVMKNILSLLFLLCALPMFAQFQNPVKFTVKQNQVSDTEVEVVFTGQIESGWHVYTADIADGGPTKAEVTLEKQKGVKPKGKLQAKGNVHRAMDDMFGMEVSYMEGNATFVQAYTITEPTYELAGYLTYGACNNQNCIPPSNVEFSFTGTGKPAKAEEAKVEDKKEEVKAEETAKRLRKRLTLSQPILRRQSWSHPLVTRVFGLPSLTS